MASEVPGSQRSVRIRRNRFVEMYEVAAAPTSGRMGSCYEHDHFLPSPCFNRFAC